MKEQLKKADLLGLAIIAAAVISYSVRSIWSPYQTIAVVVGGVLVVASLAVKSDEIRAGLGRARSRAVRARSTAMAAWAANALSSCRWPSW